MLSDALLWFVFKRFVSRPRREGRMGAGLGKRHRGYGQGFRDDDDAALRSGSTWHGRRRQGRQLTIPSCTVILFQDKLTNDTFLPALEAFAEQLEKLLAESKSGFLVHSGYTNVDFLVAENLLTCECCVPGCLDGQPKLKEYKERVFSIDKIKEYIASRKESPW